MTDATVYLKRDHRTSTETMGTIVSAKGKTFQTIELPDKDNKPNVSCIPCGRYRVRWTLSNRLKRFTYEICNVPQRTGIRFHPGNDSDDFLGCVGLGYTRGDSDHDGKMGVVSSRAAMQQFEDDMGRKDFWLEVENV